MCCVSSGPQPLRGIPVEKKRPAHGGQVPIAAAAAGGMQTRALANEDEITVQQEQLKQRQSRWKHEKNQEKPRKTKRKSCVQRVGGGAHRRVPMVPAAAAGNLRIKSMTLPKNFSRESHHCTRVHQFKLVHGYLRINARLISSERTVKYVLM